jgi:hypothetical protein
MLSNSDRDYLLARADQERRLADATSNQAAKAAHIKLANEYEVRANAQDPASKPETYVYGRSTPADGQSAFRVLDPLPSQPRRSAD